MAFRARFDDQFGFGSFGPRGFSHDGSQGSKWLDNIETLNGITEHVWLDGFGSERIAAEAAGTIEHASIASTDGIPGVTIRLPEPTTGSANLLAQSLQQQAGVVTTYTFEFWTEFFVGGPDETSFTTDVTSLANGSFAAISDSSVFSGDSIGVVADSSGQSLGIPQLTGTQGALDQLANGNLVAVTQDGDSVLFKVVSSSTGATVVASTDLGDVDTRNADVAALTGGRFVIVCEDELGAPGGDADIKVFIRNADGSAVANFTLGAVTDADTHARVAGLDNGSFVVTWQRLTGGESEIWYAVYDANGGVVKAPTIADTTDAFNEAPDVSATNGGFAIVYRGSDFYTPSAFPLLMFDAAGTQVGSRTFGTVNVADPAITRLSNGMLAIAAPAYDPGGLDFHSWTGVFDPTGLTLIAELTSLFVPELGIAGSAGGRIGLSGYSNGSPTTGGTGLIQLLIRRQSVGDEDANVITGDDFEDTIYGNGGNDVLSGGGGDDWLDGGTGINTLSGGAGNDRLVLGAGTSGSSADGGAGRDTLAISGAVSLAGLAGIESISLDVGSNLTITAAQLAGGLAADGVVTGPGTLTIVMAPTTLELHLQQLQLVPGQGTTLAVAGSASDETIEGNANAYHAIDAGGGNDQVHGGELADVIDGGADINTLFGGGGNDRLIVGVGAAGTSANGGAGTDTIAITGAVTVGTLSGLEAIELVGGATLTLSAAQFNTGFYNPIAQVGMASVSGTGSLVFNMDFNPVTAALYLTSLSFVPGSSVTLTINGTSGLDAVKGAPGVSNIINGGDDADQIRGGSLADTINGGNGNDKLFGWSGADTLTGGAGSDQFRYFFATDSGTGAAADRITDFQIGTDKFNFVIIDADPVTPDDQAFAFLGTGAFTSSGTGQIRYQDSGADLLVQVDVDGNGTVDMEVVLQGLAGQVLTGSDFML